jgi:hypothetical protein
VGNSDLNIWTNGTAALTKAWQTGSSQAGTIESKTTFGLIQQYCSDNFGPDGVYKFSMQDISLLLTQLSQHWDATGGPVLMSTIQQFGNLVSATQQIETSTGDTETKAEASYLQQSTSAQQTISDMGTSAIGILGSISSLLMQSFL